MTLDDITRALPRLTADELDKLVHAAKSLQSLGGACPAQSVSLGSDDESLVLGLIAKVLRAKGVEFVSVAQLRKAHGIDEFRAKLPDVIQFINLSHVSKILLLRIGLELLYEDCVRMNIPVSGRMLVNHMHRLPSVINAAFPGYAEAGLLGWIIRTEGE